MVEKSIHAAVDRAVRRADDPLDGTPLLTVIVPVYNEAETVAEQLARILAAPYAKQVIVVDDGSTDATPHVLAAWRDQDPFEVLTHEVNRGKGAAIRTALPYARGRFTIVQDADLEYDPEDYPRLVGPLLAGEARAVFGSRFLRETPRVPVRKRIANALRAMNSRVQGAMKSLAGRTMGALKAVLWGWMRRTHAEGDGTGKTALEAEVQAPVRRPWVHGARAELQAQDRRPWVHGARAGLQAQRWDLRCLGAAGLKLATRLLYGARLSDVAAGPKAFSTQLLRNLDLQCERFEFGPEIAAKLCRAGEKIVEVPVHFQRRVARTSWLMDRFARRPPAAADGEAKRKRAGKKHRWTDAPRAFDTLWKWRHWSLPVPDPDRIPAVAPVAGPQEATAETLPAALNADLDHWAEEDARRSGFDMAAWNDNRRQPSAEAPADSLGDAEPVASSSRARPGVFSTAAAFASFEPRLIWQEFLRKPPTKVSDDSEESYKDQDWEHWGLTDLLLLLAIANLGLVLLVFLVAPFSSWTGLLLAGLASAVTFRTTRAGKIKFDKCNQAFGILAILLVGSMFPSAWVWRGRTLIVLAALALLMGLGRLRSKGIRQLDRSLLDAIGVLGLTFAGWHVASPDRRAVELLVLLVGVTLFLGVHRQYKMRHPSDNRLLDLAAIGIFLAVVFAYLFPIDLFQIQWQTNWLWFRHAVLPHWTEFWWFRWGIVAALAAMVAALLLYREGRREAWK